MVPSFLHVDFPSDPLDDHRVLYRRRVLQRIINDLLEGDDFPSPEATIGSNHEFGSGVVDSPRKRACTEPREDHGKYGADSGCREEGNLKFGYHRHVDSYRVASLHSELLKDAGKPVDFAIEVLICQDSCVTRLALPKYRGFIFSPGLHMPIYCVIASI